MAIYPKIHNFAVMMLKRYKWVAVVFAVLCVAAQALVVVPHHHHGGSEAPCFNIVHCVEHDGHRHEEPQGCCHDHCAPEQTPAADHGCQVRVDIAEVVSEQAYRALIGGIAAVNDFYAPELVISEEQINTIHSFTLTRWRQQPPEVDKCVLFITEAHSVRAPSQV